MASPLPACLYAVAVAMQNESKQASFVGVYSGASSEEAIGAAILEWKRSHSSEYPLVAGVAVQAADYDQLAYIVAQCEQDGAA